MTVLELVSPLNDCPDSWSLSALCMTRSPTTLNTAGLSVMQAADKYSNCWLEVGEELTEKPDL